jgi:FkbM family methyltransferase
LVQGGPENQSLLALHCFEPSRPTFELLLQNDFPPNVHCNPFGLGSVAEQRTLYVVGEALGINSLFRRQGIDDHATQWRAAGEETVRIATLDSYCRDQGIPHIDFLKIDVEGYELEVLKGAAESLRLGHVAVVQFEYGGAYIDAGIRLKDIFDYVESVNRRYVFYKLIPFGLEKVPHYKQSLETYQYSNWLIVRDMVTGAG